MSGGSIRLWVLFWMADMGTPAAMRPMTGMLIPASASFAAGATRRRAARLDTADCSVRETTLDGVEAEAAPRPLRAIDSGSLTTSSARARLGRRRMNPRSSRAVIRRWMPDFDRRSSASFISSKEGGTPADCSLS